MNMEPSDATPALRITQRVFWTQVNTPEKLARVLDFFGRRATPPDEISFFTEGDGLDWRFLPLDEVDRRAAFLQTAVVQCRERGFKPVINILNTLGHSDEGGPEAPSMPFRGMQDLNGVRSRFCPCPADPAFLAYVRAKYAAFARCRADLYWIDDDVRLRYHSPVGWGCFCDDCLAALNQKQGAGYDRVSLAKELSAQPALRAAWVGRNGAVIADVLRAAADGIRQVHPQAHIGWMTLAHTHYLDSGSDFHRWFGALGEPASGRLWIRPGGGFWNEERPAELVDKAMHVAHACARAPAGVRATHEIENYPYATGAKSAAMTGLECLVSILAGRLDGLMFDVIDAVGNDPRRTHGAWFERLDAWQPLWRRAAALVAGTLPVGWQSAYSAAHVAQYAESWPHGWFEPDLAAGRAMQRAGVPVTAFDEGRRGRLLTGSAALGMNPDELRGLLAEPLLMDGHAAERFLACGLGEAIGVRSVTQRGEGLGEIFEEHPVNAADAGFRRCFTQNYFGQMGRILEPVPDAETIASAIHYRGERLGASVLLHRPAGREPVAVLGFCPWLHVLMPARMAQMRRLTTLLAGEPQPVAESDQPVVVWHRQGPGRDVLVLLNAGFDPATVRLGQRDWRLELGLEGVSFEGDRVCLPGWSVAVLAADNEGKNSIFKLA